MPAPVYRLVKVKVKPYVRDHQVAVYTPELLLKKLQAEALERQRKLGPTVLAILYEYFERKERKLAEK